MYSFEGLTQRQLREGMIRALADRHRRGLRAISYHDLGVATAQEVGRPAAVFAANNQKSLQMHGPGGINEDADVARFLAALWSLIADGTIYPRMSPAIGAAYVDGNPLTIISFLVLTPRGEAIVAQAPDHPRFSGALQRLAARHPSLAPEIVSRLDDAVRCIERGLPRPSVVMTGLAVEHTLRLAEKAMSTLNLMPTRTGGREPSALDRIGDLIKAVEAKKGEERHRLRMALVAAEQIRDRRNDAAHDPAESFSSDDADELLVSAVRAIEVLFAELITPNVPVP